MLAVIAEKLNSFWQFIKPRRKFGLAFFAIFLAIIAGSIFFHPQIAHAANSAGSGWTDTVLRLLASILLTVAEWFIKVTIFILKFIIEVGAYNGYINSPAVNVGWTMVRDLTNMFFVVILLLIAFGTILGIEQYEWKKLMMKLILAAIIVNFSRTICGIIIDVAQVIMITFINGIAATAGGNLLNMFNVNSIMKYAEGPDPASSVQGGTIFLGGVAALVFSAMMMATMAVFIIILLARLVTLWVLIVLSPIAFVLSVIPQTQKYASQWWTEFGNHVVAGPIIVFFLWLSFASFGAVNSAQDEITRGIGANSANLSVSDQLDTGGNKQGSGATEIMKWTNMANFFIAIGMLLVGARVTNQLSISGGSMMGKAVDFGKKVAMVGSGLAAGRWAAKKGADLGKRAGKAVGKGLYDITLANGVERIKNWGQTQYEGYKDWRAMGPRMKRTEMGKDEQLSPEEIARGVQMRVGEDGKKYKYDFERDENGKLIDTRGGIQKWLHGRHETLLKSRKTLKKVQDQTKTREELMDKRVTASPKYLMQAFEGEEGTFRYDALDRIEQGQLEAEKARSQEKTNEFGSLGRVLTKGNSRFKDGEWKTKGGTISQQIQAHKVMADMLKAGEEAGAEKNREKFLGKQGNEWIQEEINARETAKQMASDFLKELKEKDLTDKFHKAAEEMKKWIGMSAEDFKKKIEEAKIGKDGAYIASLAQAQNLKMVQEAGGIRKKQAEDAAKNAFVAKPRYGITTASTALSDYSESKLKNYKTLDRAAAMQKASDMMATLLHQKSGGQALDIDQEAELFAASSYLQSEAWNDDQAGYIVDKLKALQSGSLQGEEKEKWQVMAKTLHSTGNWFQKGGVDKDGNILPDSVIDGSYDRVKAADLQNIAATGGDTELVVAHNRIAKAMDSRNQDVAVRAAKARDNELRTIYKEKAISGGMNEADATELTSHATEQDLQQMYVENQARVNGVFSKIMSQGVKYWKVAEEILPTMGGAIDSVQALKQRYEKYSDFLQDATKGYKSAAVTDGHQQLGYNQDFDEDEGVYRFQSYQEGENKMRAERVKMKSRQLLNSDQYHSNGKLDLETGILDDFKEHVLNLTLGKVSKAIEIADIPERSLKGDFYVHKNEAVATVSKGGVQRMVVGGEAARKKFANDGDLTSEARLLHILARGMLPALLSGAKGFALAASKLGGHTDENQAQAGIINLSIEGQNFDTVQQMASVISDKLDDPEFLKHLAKTVYAGQEKLLKTRLQQLAKEVSKAVVQAEKKSEDEE